MTYEKNLKSLINDGFWYFTEIIEQWQQHYNHDCPHSSLGYRPPAQEAVIPSTTKTILYAN